MPPPEPPPGLPWSRRPRGVRRYSAPGPESGPDPFTDESTMAVTDLLSRSKVRPRWRGVLGGTLLALAALTGCSSGPATLSAEVSGGPQLNPDVRKRPSPV